jgi:hypothetical protein
MGSTDTSSPLVERVAARWVLGASRYSPPVLLALTIVAGVSALISQSQVGLVVAAFGALMTLHNWLRLGVYKMLQRQNFDWERVRD